MFRVPELWDYVQVSEKMGELIRSAGMQIRLGMPVVSISKIQKMDSANTAG